MTEGNYSWPLRYVIIDGGPICIFFHGAAFVLSAYVMIRAFIASRQRVPVSIGRLVCLSFLPLVLASLVIFFYLFYVAGFTPSFHIWEIGPIELPPSPTAFDVEHLESRRESNAETIARLKLYLYAGWLWTSLSLVAVRVGVKRCAPSQTRLVLPQ